MGYGGKAVGYGVTEGVPGVEVMFEEMVKSLLVGVTYMFWPARWCGVSFSGTVRLEELFSI